MRRRPIDRTQLGAVLLSTILAVSIVGAVAFLPVAAEHPSDAPDYTGDAFFEISSVSDDDHHPGQESGSMQYFAGGSEAFNDQGAEDGVYIEWVIIDANYEGEDWIDYSDCNTENTAAFGIDRGGDNEGTEYDEDLVQKQKEADFRDDGITVEFYDFDDLGGDPPYMAPEDLIVAEQGENSAAGGCLTMTDEPGWYRMDGYLSGTVADNGEGEPPSDDADEVEVQVQSTWFYVCDCDSEEEAEEELGPPPGEDSDAEADEDVDADDEEADDDAEAEEEPEADDDAEAEEEPEADDDAEAEEEPEADDDAEAEEEPEADDDEAEADDDAETDDEVEADDDAETDDEVEADDDAETDDEVGADDDAVGEEAEGEQTPSADDGPGFGAGAAILALLASALFLTRRR